MLTLSPASASRPHPCTPSPNPPGKTGQEKGDGALPPVRGRGWGGAGRWAWLSLYFRDCEAVQMDLTYQGLGPSR